MQRLIGLLVLLTFVLFPQITEAGSGSFIMKKAMAASISDTNTVTNFRWATHTDAASGMDKIRLVLDMTDQVTPEAKIENSPNPRLVISLKGVKPGKIDNTICMDGSIVEKVNIRAQKDNKTEVVVNLPAVIGKSDFRIFTLKQDKETNKPYRVVVDINKPIPPTVYHFTAGIKNKIIVLDPGHGGSDSGAVGPKKVLEKDVTLATAKQVQALLENAGAKVIMTRKDDQDVYGPNATATQELNARSEIANNNKADLFISIHANSFTVPTAGGTSTYYYSKSKYDALLADAIQTKLAAAGGLQDRGINQANFYVVKHTAMPAVLIELAFVSNPKEEVLLKDGLFQRKMSQAIVQGIDDFFAQASNAGGGR